MPNKAQHVDKTFHTLVNTIKQFRMTEAPSSEQQIERELLDHIIDHNFNAFRQKTTVFGRNDIYVFLGSKKVIIELKRIAGIDCAKQLDKYSKIADGMILVCWKASKILRNVFNQVQQTAKIPVELIELQELGDLV